ncbi:MAG: proline--tRNA ligase, partial [Planctomycetota bacterium]
DLDAEAVPGELLLHRASAAREEKTVSVDSWDDFVSCFEGGKSSFVHAHWDGTQETELAIKDATKATIRCIPLTGEGPAAEPGKCVKTGAESKQRVLFAKNY